ncbi:glycerophosphodiester phosphodiesterase [Halomarina ordinaria]|uniref:Glycerophosphodiester phosphodiesterase n=1 Tax=Halomarina ordinaria TaxID=3033939 RepID=A0ABD5UAN3_9EURY|nr:glycerophosphodiester phosphodiesterase [Halomarina sp. PSRA2]
MGPDIDRRTFVKGIGTTAATATLGAGSAVARGGYGGKEEDGHDDRGDTDRDWYGDAPALIAHRGFAGQYPENTVGAVELAARGGHGPGATRRGADMIEIDIVPTADGDVVVFHDDGLAERDGGERGLTDVEGLVWETPTETVLDAEVLGSGETVPLLSTVLDAIPPHVAVNVEFKNPGSLDLRFAESLDSDALAAQKGLWRPFTERALDAIEACRNDVLVSSFYEAALATVRDLAPDLPVAPLLWDSIEDGLAIARRYDAEAVHPPYNMVRGTPFYGDPYYTEGPWSETDLLAVAHEEGRAVNVYTVATWYQAQELVDAGVDGIIGDYSNLLAFGERS